jgi:amino acid adenylation domain-containing protein
VSDLSERIAGLSPEARARLEAQLLKGATAGGPEGRVTPRTSRTEPAPLAFAQQRLWFLEQLEPHSPLYNVHAAFRVQGALDAAALQTALDGLVARHEALRTTFAAPDGQPVQVVGAPRPVPLAVVDLTAHPEPEREAACQRCLAAEVRRPFDLTRDLLLRALLVRLGADEHVLLVAKHHIASDGWSTGVLWRELGQLYAAAVAGRPPDLPALPIQYADYAIWQRQWLQGDVLAAQLAYWRDRLAGAPAHLELPTDRPRPAVQTTRGAHRTRTLPPALRAALEALGRQAGATLFMTLLAAFQALLARYTGQEDIVVGSPIAGRTRVETEGLIGFFVNTLVLRTDLAGNPPFRELLGRVREGCLGAYAHQELPFEKLVEELQPARTLSQSPLFQVMFILQNAPRTPLALPGLTLTPFRVESGTAKFELTLAVTATDAGLQTTAEYNADLFDAATVDRLLGHYQTLLEGIVAAPDRPIGALPLLTEAERHQLLVAWNATDTAYPRDCRVHELFEAQVARTPEAVAVAWDDQTLSYGELNRRANRLAHYLRRIGVDRGRFVGVFMNRSPELIVALVGILKAGGAYVPLDLASPADRIAGMLQDADTAVLITESCLLDRLSAHGERVLCLEPGMDGSDLAELETNPVAEGNALDLAYIMYTSGSTGRPKGVTVPHRGVVRLVKNTNYAHLTADEVFLQLAPVSFDASTLEIWGSLLNGARLVLYPEPIPSLDALAEVLERHRVSLLWLTAGLFHQVVEERLDALRPVRQLLAGGDVLAAPDVRKVLERFPGSCVINGYGPTENTTFTCCHAMTDPAQVDDNVSIGRPIANTRVYILDNHTQPVPIGIRGELWIGGDGLASGYLNQPELTAERFIADPFNPAPDSRMYRTGDFARYMSDGSIQFLGRLDEQVKIRGYRIELGEVETSLMRHPAVRQAVVVAQTEPKLGKRLVAYLVAGPDGSTEPELLREFLKNSLPSYMIPTLFVWLDRLPLTPNGKVDRRALPAPGKEIVSAASPMPAGPRDELELRLARLWEEVLDVRPVGRTESFFELGGHSLLAVKLFARMEEEFGRQLPLSVLFEASTVEQLAALMRRNGWSPSWRSLVPIQPHGSKLPIALVPGVGGNVLSFADLARALGPDCPTYGLQARGLDGREAPFTRIEDIAAHHIEELRTVQPHGPYRLVGACIGGVIALEMAHQLIAQGEPIGMLAMLDAWPPRPGRRGTRWSSLHPTVVGLELAARRFLMYGRRLATLRSKERWALLVEKARRLRTLITQRHSLSEVRSEIHGTVVERANLQALRQYVLRPYPGQILYIFARRRDVSPRHDARAAWRDYALGGVEIHSLPVEDSGQMLVEPHVRGLADYLTTYLQRQTARGTLAEPDEQPA